MAVLEFLFNHFQNYVGERTEVLIMCHAGFLVEISESYSE